MSIKTVVIAWGMVLYSVLSTIGAFAQKKEETKMKLIYVMDAQCGWCYGNGFNMASIYQEFQGDYDFEFINGGMWLGNQAPTAGSQISSYIQSHLPRFESYTGIIVSNEYKSLIKDSDYVMSSLEPSAAIVLSKKLAPDHVFEFAKEVQLALFDRGMRLNEFETYLPILEKFDIDPKEFKSQWLSEENLKATYAEFQSIQGVVNGFPALILEANGQKQLLASGYFQLDAMRKALTELKQQEKTAVKADGASCEIGEDCD
ncbi:DsbA family protein [bacterium SCSIO 12741]|nr:DsbA family protein [bacterium SCSIO 12741]